MGISFSPPSAPCPAFPSYPFSSLSCASAVRRHDISVRIAMNLTGVNMEVLQMDQKKPWRKYSGKLRVSCVLYSLQHAASRANSLKQKEGIMEAHISSSMPISTAAEPMTRMMLCSWKRPVSLKAGRFLLVSKPILPDVRC